MTKSWAGIAYLTNNNTYSGTTTIASGTLGIGNGGTAGSLGTGPVVNNGSLVFDRYTNNWTVASPISGSGSVTKRGGATMTLSGSNTFSGDFNQWSGVTILSNTTGPALSGLVQESEHVVETIERMRMLLRSVQTDHGPVDVANILHDAVTYAATEMARHDVDISIRGTDAACYVEGDAGQLQVAVVNLLRNAAEAIAAGASESRCIEVELVRRPSEDGRSRETVELVVGDSGTGIGLYVVRATVGNHGGELRIGRSPLGGAEFRIVLTGRT